MKALAINGSPRNGGNTEILLTKVLAPLEAAGWETELVQVGGRAIRGCMACKKCFETKDMECIIKNDILNETVKKMSKADAIILGSPTYFADVTAEMKALIDRSGYVSIANGGLFKGKVGSSVSAVRRAGALRAFDTMNHFLHLTQMVMPGSTYWNLGIGREIGEVDNDEEGLRNMNHLGKMINWLGTSLKDNMDKFPK
ncbi:MAG: flavodoxin family protein [Denitrovibrio sp.]|nr:MAG: flavodoxin family protein [Denitrovibrio sp.]